MSINQLTSSDFAEMLGVDEASITAPVHKLISDYQLKYRDLPESELEDVKQQVRNKIEQGGFTEVGEHRHNIWELAWKEAQERFVASNYNLEALDPNFIGASKFVRLRANYVEGVTDKFELMFFRVFREWLAETYLKPFHNLYEFGCGSGFNLGALAQKFPEKNLMGFDWAEPAVDILRLLAEKRGFNLGGKRFDFFNPDKAVKIPSDTAVLTFCAFEQIGDRHTEMLKYLLQQKPDIVAQMEPTVDYYDSANPVDDLAIKYHTARKYLSGYLPALKKLAAEGKIEIIKTKRLGFGSLYHECYTLHVWRPL